MKEQMIKNHARPAFWKTTLLDIEQMLLETKKGKTSILGHSAGNRPIHLISYGEKETFNRQANYSSALGAGNAKYYADKGDHHKPVVLIIGGIHGGEFEGIVAINNLIKIMDTGADLREQKWNEIYKLGQQVRLLLIPCANPDGRARVSVDSMIGVDFNEFRYHVQGTWKDGTLCGWPDCKRIHPIADHVDYLGGYFNDDGVNLAHDNMFAPYAEETKVLLKLADIEAPDFTVQLHGGDNCVNQTLPIKNVPGWVRHRQYEFEIELAEMCKARGLRFYHAPLDADEDIMESSSSFDLNAAIHHSCGGLSFTYESNMGLDYGRHILNEDEILDHHLILFESILRFTLTKG